jgi:glycosyltransferase involved in cell wall biosynthesis
MTTAILTSFNRPAYIYDCVRTLKEHYPHIKVIIGENGTPDEELGEKVEKMGAKYVVLPFDCGVPYVRNRLFEMVDTKYVLVGDDDFFYTPEAHLTEMQTFLEAHAEYAMIGGRVIEHGQVKDYQGYVEGGVYTKYRAEDLKYKKCKKSGLEYTPIDMMTNFWIGRLKDLPKYNEDHKIYHEHTDYMLSLKVKMAFSPQPLVLHKYKRYYYPNYGKYRFRPEERDYIRNKYNLKSQNAII